MATETTTAERLFGAWDAAENPWQDLSGIDYMGSDALTLALGGQPGGGQDSLMADDGSALEYMGDDREWEVRSSDWTVQSLKEGICRMAERGEWVSLCQVAAALEEFL